MAQVYDKEVAVCVWDYSGPGHPGHAAMKFKGVPGFAGNRSNGYVSFWPEDSAGLGNAFTKIPGRLQIRHQDDQWDEMGDRTNRRLNEGIYQPNALQHARQMQTADGDRITQWLQRPHHKIHIPGKGAANLAFGLDLVGIYEWWKIFSNSPDLKYKFGSKKINCAGVILVALLKGGADRFADVPTANLFIDPNQVRQFAEAVKQRVDDLNANATGLDIAAAAAMTREYQFAQVNDLPTYLEWKGMTVLAGAGRAHVSDIDNALKRYHEAKDRSPAKKVERLGDLLKVIRKHTMKYPLSRRGGSVMDLGKMALHVLRITINANGVTRPDWFINR